MMETAPSKAKQEQGSTERSLVPHNRPDIYTVRELCQSLMEWTLPVRDVLTWQLPTVSSAWLTLGLLAIFLLTRFSLPSVVGMAGLVVLGLVMLYAAFLRVEPYEELRRRQILVRVSVPPEVVELVASRLTNWTNRWVATAQYLLFGRDYGPGVLVAIVALNLVILGSLMDSATLLMAIYGLAFVLPKLWPQVARKWGHLWQQSGLRALIMGQRLLLQLNQDILQAVEQVKFGSSKAVPDGAGDIPDLD